MPYRYHTIEFTLVDIAGSTEHGYMNHVVFTVIDANHRTGESTWSLPGDKQFQVRGVNAHKITEGFLR